MGARTKSPAQRRNDLLDAVEGLLLEKSIGELTVEDLANRAGVAKGTFYLYFQSKEHVVDELRIRFVERIIVQQNLAVTESPEGDWVHRLETWMATGIREYLAHSALHDALFSHGLGNVRGRGETAPENQHIVALRDLLSRGVECGAFTVSSVEAASVLLYSAMHGAADHLIDHPGIVDPEELVAEACRLCCCFVATRA